MAGVLKVVKVLPGKTGFHTMAVRAAGSPPPWNYLWKPGPYPETESDRIKAAKKYGLIYEDYKPYPKGSDVMAGDYPNLPLVPEAHRSPFKDWDYPEYRRDYGEPLHEEWDMYRETRYTPIKNGRYTEMQMLAVFFSILGTLLGCYYISEDNPWIPNMKQPVSAPQLYRPGVVHYTFEPAE